MKIGMIGAGEIGGTLVKQYSQAGHRVKMTNATGLEKLRTLEAETGATAVSMEEVVRDVDVIVISIPLIGILKLPDGLFDNAPDNTAIVDTCNYYPIRDGIIPEIENGMPESLWVSNKIQRPVIKAYNNIFFHSLVHSGVPKGSSLRVALPIAGDSKKSKDLVFTLIEHSGFDPLDYGSLLDSWKQQPGSPVYCTDLTLIQLKKSINKVRRDVLPERRELGLKYILQHDPTMWRENVEYNRKIYESDLVI